MATQALTPLNRRALLETALDRLLAAVEGILADLDALDGDPDLEPSLGAPESRFRPSDQRHWADGVTSDLEEQVETDPDDWGFEAPGDDDVLVEFRQA